MTLKTYILLAFLPATGLLTAQMPPPPPAAPPPPAFMGMKGYPLSCFAKPNFEEDGVEFFVCNGGAGLAGFRRKVDAAHTVFVRDPDVAQNLNMQTAKGECASHFAVRADADGVISFLCQGKEIDQKERFKPASKSDWKKYSTYLAK